MTTIIGFSPYSGTSFKSSSPGIRDIYSLLIKNGVYDEVHVQEQTLDGFIESSEKTRWQNETRLIARFLGDLEAGNVQNEGIQIEQFAIKRRKIDDLDSTTLGYRPFENNKTVEYTDYTQSNDKFIYSVVPVGENEFEGVPNEVEVESDFVGWWIVDKDEQQSLGFDTSVDGYGDQVSSNLNQGRVQIETMTKYPSVYYTDQEYSEFTLEASFVPYEWERSGHKFESILNKYVRSHKPFIVKGSDGSIYVADIHSPQKSSPRNTYKNYDYVNVAISCVEVQDYKDFIEE